MNNLSAKDNCSVFIVVCVTLTLLSGCSSFIIDGDSAQVLNAELDCNRAPCPFHLDQRLGYLNLMPGYRLGVSSLTIDLPTTAGQEVFPSSRNANARTLAPPRLNSYSFRLPKDEAPLSREEALFVAFLLSASRDDDNSTDNTGRNYSELVKEYAPDSERYKKLLRSFTREMRMSFPLVDGHTVYDSYRRSWCSPESKLGPNAPVDIQSLIVKRNVNGANHEYIIGRSTDWSFAWTVKDLVKEQIHTGVLPDYDFANSMYQFSVTFPVTDENTGEEIIVSSCETLGALAARLNSEPHALIRSCELAPDSSIYRNKKFWESPCSEKDKEVEIRFQDASEHSFGTGRHVLVNANVARQILLAPGDRVRLNSWK